MPTIGHNSKVELPDDMAEATRWVFERAKRIGREVAGINERIKDELKEAKGKGADAQSLRLASKLERMTPEKFDQWLKRLNAATAMIGAEPVDVVSSPDANHPFRGALDVIVQFERDKRDLQQSLSEIFGAAKARGIDVASLRTFLRMSATRDAIEMGDWFDAIDRMGQQLGIWNENFEDLQAAE